MAEGHSSSGTLEVTVVSPARQLYTGEARFVTAPAWEATDWGRIVAYRFPGPDPDLNGPIVPLKMVGTLPNTPDRQTTHVSPVPPIRVAAYPDFFSQGAA